MAFYCNGKKNFCTESECKDTDCEYYNGEGGEYEPDLVMLKTNAQKHELVKLKTNADRIRAMNDEELANFLHNVVCKFMCEYCKEYERIKAAKGHANCNGECDKAYLEWLKQPAE